MAVSDIYNTLTLAHLNINGLNKPEKVDALKQLMLEHDVDIMSINETKVCGTDKGLDIPGYKLYRRDRDHCLTGRDGGGVALYVRGTIPHTELPNTGTVESLWVQLNDRPLVIGTMYRPPGKLVEFLTKMKFDISKAKGNNRLVLMGDLNYDYTDSPDKKKLMSLV